MYIFVFQQGGVDSAAGGDIASAESSTGNTIAARNTPVPATSKRGGPKSGKDDDAGGEEVNRLDILSGAVAGSLG